MQEEPQVSQEDYYQNARMALLGECCLQSDQLPPPCTEGFMVLHLRTRDGENIIGSLPGYKRLYKHVFLQSNQFKQEVIQYYRSLGYGWIDIVPLNRVDWKIFIWNKDN